MPNFLAFLCHTWSSTVRDTSPLIFKLPYSQFPWRVLPRDSNTINTNLLMLLWESPGCIQSSRKHLHAWRLTIRIQTSESYPTVEMLWHFPLLLLNKTIWHPDDTLVLGYSVLSFTVVAIPLVPGSGAAIQYPNCWAVYVHTNWPFVSFTIPRPRLTQAPEKDKILHMPCSIPLYLKSSAI